MGAVGLGTKLGMMLASLMFSVILWMTVEVLQPRAPRVLRVPVSYENLDESRYKRTSGPEEISVTIDGTEEHVKRVVDGLASRPVIGVVDLRDATPGEARYPLRVLHPRDLPVDFQALQSVVMVEVEPIVRREVPVTIETMGQIAADKSLLYLGAKADPEKVAIIGPASEIEQVDKVRALLDLSKVEPGIEITEGLEPLTSGNRPLSKVSVSPLIVRIRPAMTAAPEVKTVLVSPTFVGQPAVGHRLVRYTVFPNQVNVVGSSNLLARLATVSTGPIRIEASSRTMTYRAIIVPPDGVRVSGSKDVRVRVEIEAVPSGRLGP